MKTTYLLINAARGQYQTPLGVGLPTIGHAFYEEEYGAHVFRVSQADWEGDHQQGGLDRQIAENSHRAFQKWIVRAIVEDDSEVGAALEAALKENAALKGLLEEYGYMQPEPGQTTGTQLDIPQGSALVTNPDGSKVVAPIAGKFEEPWAYEGRWAVMTMNELVADMERANELGAQIRISYQTTKAKAVAALTEWANAVPE